MYPDSYYGKGRRNSTAKLVIANQGLNYYRYTRRLASSMKSTPATVSHGSRSVSRGRKRARSTSRSRSRSVPAAKGKKKARVSRSRSRTLSRTKQEEESGQHGDLSKSFIKIVNGRVPKGYRGLVKGCIQHQYVETPVAGTPCPTPVCPYCIPDNTLFHSV